MPADRIAYFVSPHGFGHAARAGAVMAALRRLDPACEFEIFTRAPGWFFADTLGENFNYHELASDIGLVQRSPLAEDLEATLQQLRQFIPFSQERLQPIARRLVERECCLAICDISPLGIAAAHAAGLPAILVENFTWDWIYAGYLEAQPGFADFIPEFARVFQSADAHIQTEPVCAPTQARTLLTHPVARRPRLDSATIRKQLRIPAAAPTVLVSMGGFEAAYPFLDRLEQMQEIFFIIPGGAPAVEIRRNLVLLPHHSAYYHPDLLYASNAVVSKAGYSTIAEAYHAGIPFGYVSRARFRESPVLSAFIAQQMQGLPIDGAAFDRGEWIEMLPALLSLPRIQRNEPNGADQIANYIYAKRAF